MIDLHYSAAPNGRKIAIMLEEIGAAYRVIPCEREWSNMLGDANQTAVQDD